MIKAKHKGAANELEAILWLLQQGYEVFRNVSQHGPIDIIAINREKTLYLDVSSASDRTGSDEQILYGTKLLSKQSDGTFAIKEMLTPIGERLCTVCGKPFTAIRRNRRICSRQCKNYRSNNRYRGPSQITTASEATVLLLNDLK